MHLNVTNKEEFPVLAFVLKKLANIPNSQWFCVQSAFSFPKLLDLLWNIKIIFH
jgi:hypothetical protein